MNDCFTATNASSDFSADIHALAQLVASPADVHDVLQRALDALSRVVPYNSRLSFAFQAPRPPRRGSSAPWQLPSCEPSIDLLRFPTIRTPWRPGVPSRSTKHAHASAEGDPYDGVIDLPHGHSCMVEPRFSTRTARSRPRSVDRGDAGAIRNPCSTRLASTGSHLAHPAPRRRERLASTTSSPRRARPARIEESGGGTRHRCAAGLAENGMLEVISQARNGRLAPAQCSSWVRPARSTRFWPKPYMPGAHARHDPS